MLRHELLHVGAADLLVALDAELHGTRQLAPDLLPGPDGSQAGDDVALIVGDATTVQLPIAQGGLERGGRPELQRLRRLHVVVVVEEERFGGDATELSVHDGLATGWPFGSAQGMLGQDTHLEAEVPEEAGDMLRRLLHRRALGADAGELTQLRQLGDGLVQVLIKIRVDIPHVSDSFQRESAGLRVFHVDGHAKGVSEFADPEFRLLSQAQDPGEMGLEVTGLLRLHQGRQAGAILEDGRLHVLDAVARHIILELEYDPVERRMQPRPDADQ